MACFPNFYAFIFRSTPRDFYSLERSSERKSFRIECSRFHKEKSLTIALTCAKYFPTKYIAKQEFVFFFVTRLIATFFMLYRVYSNIFPSTGKCSVSLKHTLGILRIPINIQFHENGLKIKIKLNFDFFHRNVKMIN